MFKIFISFFITLLLASKSYAQAPSVLVMDGVVYGYDYDASRKLFGKGKQPILEGALEDATIVAFVGDSALNGSISGERGEFTLQLPHGKFYRIEIKKEGYNKIQFFIDFTSSPKPRKKTQLQNLEFILNHRKPSTDAKTESPIGTLHYQPGNGTFYFEPNKNRITRQTLLGEKSEPDNLVELMKRGMAKNNSSEVPVSKEKALPKKTEENAEPLTETLEKPKISLADFKLKPVKGGENLMFLDINQREREINEAKRQLAFDKIKASTSDDYLLLLEREQIIQAAIDELKTAKLLISLQNEKIDFQNKSLLASIAGSLVLAGLLLLLYYHFRSKSKTNKLLEVKNRKINESLEYAQRIQNSILLEEREIQEHLPESFIYYQPKDVVSGDFYWFSEIDGKLIVAVADCTGHGVPGAFMSMIGNTLLNQIIKEKKILSPSQIMEELHLGIMEALRKDKQEKVAGDGMEMSVCMLDKEKGILEFSGAMSQVYLVKEKNIQILKGDLISIGGKSLRPGKRQSVKFKTHKLVDFSNTAVYMFTDGYMDQFGGDENKKFNTTNFKNLLLEIQGMDMKSQKEKIHQSLENWKESRPQVDDILVAGFKV